MIAELCSEEQKSRIKEAPLFKVMLPKKEGGQRTFISWSKPDQDGSIYKGELNVELKKEGLGIHIKPNKWLYIGEFKDNKAHGRGRMIM